jgi:methyl-accepting chemotaxis protein
LQFEKRRAHFIRLARPTRPGSLHHKKGRFKVNFLQSFRINTRLLAGFATVLALMGIGSLVGIWQLNNLERVIDRLATEEVTKLTLTERWTRSIATNLVRAQSALTIDAKDELAQTLRIEMEVSNKQAAEHKQMLESMVTSPEGKKHLEKVSEARQRYRDYRDQLTQRHMKGEDVRDDLKTKLVPLANTYLGVMHEFLDWEQAQLEAARRNATDAAHSARIWIMVAAACGLLSGLAIALLLSRSIVAPIIRARDSARLIAAGDLNGVIELSGRDEAAEMLRDLAEMQRSLRAIVDEVRQGADVVTVTSGQIAAGNTDLSSRTEEQASSIEETAASLEELTSTVNQNAENAKKADELAASASKIANRGGVAVGEVVRTMDDIQRSSRKISEIIGVIDSIAFQTNILALNAAVEAARAGEQGRGFAVVASEVRNLAQRSASAAKEIKALITDSVQTVDSGSKLAGNAGATMQEVVDSVKRVSEIIGQIAVATQEQSAGIGQVATAVTELDRVTQQNAALVEESTAASESLKEQAARLAQSVAVFKHDQGSVAALPDLRQPRPPGRLTAAPKTGMAVRPVAAQKRKADEWTEF